MSGSMSASASMPTPRPQRLGIVTPLANERETFDPFITRILAQLLPQDQVFCVFDNVCTDGTIDLAREWSKRDARVVVVWSPVNRCVVDAYFRGYREAMTAGCDWILEMDGGLSHQPEQIPRFIGAMQAGRDYAGGSRFVEGGAFNGRLSRHVISRGGTMLTNFLLGTQMRDMTSGFECFTRKAMSRVLEHGVHSKAHFFQTEIRSMMHEFNWVEIPITYDCPSNSVGKSSLSDAFKTLWALWWQRGQVVEEVPVAR